MNSQGGHHDRYVSIPDSCNENCPVILDGVACDGFVRGMQTGAITHFHQDHIAGLDLMLAWYKRILVHPVTFAALSVLNGAVGHRENFEVVGYGKPVSIPGGTASLLPAGHIPGSCQVLVEHEGSRLLYSGDFAYPGADPPKCDYLVLDATHGDPSYEQSASRDHVMSQMLARTTQEVEAGGSVTVVASRGTLQEIMEYFGRNKDKMPGVTEFIAPRTEIDVFKATYSGNSTRMLDRASADADGAMYSGRPCILFTSSMRADGDTEGWFRVQAGRFGPTVGRPAVQDVEGGIRCDIPSHSDYEGILEYVRRADPEFVLTDSSRSNSAEYLAGKIRDTLHIDAEASGGSDVWPQR